MPQVSLRGILSYATSLLTQHPLPFGVPNPFSFGGQLSADVGPYVPLSGAPSCPLDGPMSCHNSTPAGDSCCFVYPSGRLLMTQFWDREIHAGGAEEDWTVHGLWCATPYVTPHHGGRGRHARAEQKGKTISC